MISESTKQLLSIVMAHAEEEKYGMMVLVFNADQTRNEGVEVLCSMNMPPQYLQQMAKEALSVAAEGPKPQPLLVRPN